MSDADGSVKSTLKKPLICVEWTAVIPDEYEETLSPKFCLKSVQCQFILEMLYIISDLAYCLCLDVVRSDELDKITECFRCTLLAVSEFDLKLPPPSITEFREKCLWVLQISALEFRRIRGKTISFRVVLEENGGSTQEEGDCDWSLSPKSLHSLCIDFAKLLDDPRSADVKLLCGDMTIPAHKTILGARSEVFERMLQTDMVERRTGSIEIPDIEPRIIKEFLRYLYTGALPEMTVEKALLLYEAGDKYDVRSLVEECRNYLGKNLTVDNACDVLVLADNHGDSDLKKWATVFIALVEIPLDTNIWKEFRREHPMLAFETVEFAYKFSKHKISLK